MEGGGEAVAAGGHHFGADGDADVDVAERDLVGNVLGCFQARGAEAVDGGGGGGVGDAGSEGGGTDDVGGFAVIDLNML